MHDEELDAHERQGNGKLVLWLGLGCLGFVLVVSAMLGGAGYLLYQVAKERLVAEGSVEAPPPAEFGTLPGEVFDRDHMPAPPLDLPEPAAPASALNRTDLTIPDPSRLRAMAHQFYENRQFQKAVQCQYQSVVRADEGRYNLACYYARSGDVPAALYWLQECARVEDSNAVWASRDHDLIPVRKDPRWPALLNYLRAWQKYWETSNHAETSLVLPRVMPPDRKVPVFIGLHGLGGNAVGFVSADSYQLLADEMGVAFLGVSGSAPRGKRSFAWSEDCARDLERIDAALAEVADRLTPETGKVALFGFSQGAAVSAELAARHPDRFAGAIVLSPGSLAPMTTTLSDDAEAVRRLGIVVVCGKGEHPATVARTKFYTDFFQRAGARVESKIYPEMNTHTFPPDFREQLRVWKRFILDGESPRAAF
jgi:predicted esterase